METTITTRTTSNIFIKLWEVIKVALNLGGKKRDLSRLKKSRSDDDKVTEVVGEVVGEDNDAPPAPTPPVEDNPMFNQGDFFNGVSGFNTGDPEDLESEDMQAAMRYGDAGSEVDDTSMEASEPEVHGDAEEALIHTSVEESSGDIPTRSGEIPGLGHNTTDDFVDSIMGDGQLAMPMTGASDGDVSTHVDRTTEDVETPDEAGQESLHTDGSDEPEEETSAYTATEDTTNEKEIKEMSNTVLENPSFTLMEGSDDSTKFANGYDPNMAVLSYIGNTDMLVDYIHRLSMFHHVTMPLRACGIDPVVFDHVTRISYGENEDNTDAEPSNFFPVEEKDEAHTEYDYEIISVDGELYMSCVTDCIDRDYLSSIIAEATTAMIERGEYVFRMVGLRRISVDGTVSAGTLFNTLRLNTYEMSTLCTYMEKFGVQPAYQVIEGHECIVFKK